MSATYSPANHPLLSTEAAGLEPDALDAQAVIAERVLGLSGVELTGAEAEEAVGYVARQVNLQVRHGSAGGDIVSESKGGQSFTYSAQGGARVAVDPLAWRGVQELLRAPWPASSDSAATIVW